MQASARVEECRAEGAFLGQDFGGLNIAEWADQETPEREWIVPDFVPAGLLTFLTGDGTSGKSLLMQQLCTCVAAGRPFLGKPMAKGRALYVTAEDDAKELHKRQKAICSALQADLRTMSSSLALRSLVDSSSDVSLARYEPGRAADAEFRQESAGFKPTSLFRELRRQIDEEGHRLVVLDNVSHFFTGNENDRHEVASFVRLLSGLCVRTGCAIVLVGFPNKAGEEYSGSTAWSNQVRSRIYLHRPSNADPDRLSLSNPKANYAADAEIIFRYRHPLSYVLESDLPEDVREASRLSAMAASDNDIFLKLIQQLEDQGRRVTPNHAPNYAPKVMESMPLAKHEGLTKDRLTEAMNRLLQLEAIEFVEVGKDTKGKTQKALRRAAK